MVKDFAQSGGVFGGVGESVGRKALFFKARELLTDSGSGEGGVLVGGVFCPEDSLFPQSVSETRFGDGEEGSREGDSVSHGKRTHGGESVQPALVGEADQEGLRLIFKMMGEHNDWDAIAPAPSGHQTVSDLSRAGLEGGFWGFASMAEDDGGDAARFGESGGDSGFQSGVFSEGVIYNESEDGDFPSLSALPTSDEIGERHGVAAA